MLSLMLGLAVVALWRCGSLDHSLGLAPDAEEL